MRFTWNSDGTLTVEEVSFTTVGEEVHETVAQSLRLTGEEWLRVVTAVLGMLPGKLNSDGNSFLLAPYGADPDMIGALVASMLRSTPPFDRS